MTAEGYTGYVKVTAANYKGERDNPHGGVLHKWDLDFTAKATGHDYGGVYWQTKRTDPITEGDEFHGEISEGQYGWRFKLTPDTSGAPQPRTEGPKGGAVSKSHAGNAAAHREASTPPADWVPTSWTREAYGGFRYEASDRFARAERRDCQARALEWGSLHVDDKPALKGLWKGRPEPLPPLYRVIDWFVADLDNASIQKPNRESPSHTARAQPTGGAASDKGPERHSVSDPLPPTDTAESVQADASKPLDAKGEKKLLKALNDSPIAKQHHDALRAWYGADRVDGARKLWKALSGLDNGQVDAFLTRHGITPASDVPLEDDEDLPSADDLEKRAAELGLEVMEG